MIETAFWTNPDYHGGDNLRDGAAPFWMLPPLTDVEPYDDYSGDPGDRTMVQNAEGTWRKRRTTAEITQHRHRIDRHKEREVAWLERANGLIKNHGVCMVRSCGWPVNKDGRGYYCENDECRMHNQRWS